MDPDGESPTIAWVVQWFKLTGEFQSMLNPAVASSGDVLECIATATDAMGGADTASISCCYKYTPVYQCYCHT